MKKKRIVVAMSGGVDSSVAAANLLEEGYDVVGLTMNLFSLPKEYCRDENLKSCCGWGAAEDAFQVAQTLGIPHYVVDMRDSFEDKVIKNFCAEYERGRTPNPCIRCNEFVKFDDLMRRADKLDAEGIATGHHARIEFDAKMKRYLLKKGRDKNKDQSYFLYTLTQEQMSRTLMPIGVFTKSKIRKKAEELNLLAAKRPESQEICFVPDNDYARFLRERIPGAFRPGPIIDLDGNTLGRHRGILHYTIGQRRGMGIAAPHPLYVLRIEAQDNTVVAGENRLLYKKELVASKLNSIWEPTFAQEMRVQAKIRYKHKEADALLKPLGKDRICVRFDKPQRAITPGQAVVFYRDETVIGGGIIQ